MDPKFTCDICFLEVENAKVAYLGPCKHSLCYQCFLKAVVEQKRCPFCKQTVQKVTVDDVMKPTEDFEWMIASSRKTSDQSWFEEANFELLDQEFFIEDLRVMEKNLKEAYDTMTRVVKQKDPQYDQKWFIFEQLEIEVSKLTDGFDKECPQKIDPASFYQKILHIDSSLSQVRLGRWSSELLNGYKQLYADSRVFHEEKSENFLQNSFVVVTKRKLKKRK